MYRLCQTAKSQDDRGRITSVFRENTTSWSQSEIRRMTFFSAAGDRFLSIAIRAPGQDQLSVSSRQSGIHSIKLQVPRMIMGVIPRSDLLGAVS